MSKRLQHELSARERQIMEVVYSKKRASVKEVLAEIPNPPSYSAVRAMLNILENKGFLKHQQEGLKYIYAPTIPHKKAMRSAVQSLLKTYFNNSVEEAVAAIINFRNKDIDEIELARLTKLIKSAKEDSAQ